MHDASSPTTTTTTRAVPEKQKRTTTMDIKSPPSPPPPQYPSAAPKSDTKSSSVTDANGNAVAATAPGPSSQVSAKNHPDQKPGLLKRVLSKDNRVIGRRFFSAYAQTWIGLSPLWLMGEAIIPGKKVGSQFNKGRKNLATAAEEVGRAVTTSGKDVVVIIDEKLRSTGGGKQVAERTAEVIKAAGENAILVVTTSLDKLSSHLPSSDSKGKDKHSFDLHKLANDAELKRTLNRHGRDALVLLDNALKHPVVVTGVAGFARSRGIPHADALLRLASLGLGRILRAMPEDIQEEVSEHVEAKIEEIDAEELERMSTPEERQEADSLGKVAEQAHTPKVEGETSTSGKKDDPYADMRKKNECIVM